jgi:hypothetical protein
MIRGSYTPEVNKLPPPPPKRNEADRLLCALVTALDVSREEIRGHGHRAPGRWDADGSECAQCRAWRQAREYVRAITAGRKAGKDGINDNLLD